MIFVEKNNSLTTKFMNYFLFKYFILQLIKDCYILMISNISSNSD